MNLQEVARELSRRLASLFLRDPSGQRPCHGGERRYVEDPHWRDLALFHEYFHGETGRGCGASHQTGWSALAIRFIEDWARSPDGEPDVNSQYPNANSQRRELETPNSLGIGS